MPEMEKLKNIDEGGSGKRNNCKARYRVHGEQQGKLLNNITKVFQEKEKEQASNRNRGTETRSHWVIVGCH